MSIPSGFKTKEEYAAYMREYRTRLATVPKEKFEQWLDDAPNFVGWRYSAQDIEDFREKYVAWLRQSLVLTGLDKEFHFDSLGKLCKR